LLSHFSFTGAIMSIVIIVIAGILIASMFKRIRRKQKIKKNQFSVLFYLCSYPLYWGITQQALADITLRKIVL
jgi:dipeptide/tripeptide permease